MLPVYAFKAENLASMAADRTCGHGVEIVRKQGPGSRVKIIHVWGENYVIPPIIPFFHSNILSGPEETTRLERIPPFPFLPSRMACFPSVKGVINVYETSRYILRTAQVNCFISKVKLVVHAEDSIQVNCRSITILHL